MLNSGLGLFTKREIEEGHEFGITHVFDIRFENGYIRTPLGGFINHNTNPNCKLVEVDKDIFPVTKDSKCLKLVSIRKIEQDERNDYFEWDYENHYHGWDRGVLEWAQGFHPGRWILMDMKRGETLEDIRDLEDWGAYTEERFIRNKDHIDDLL